MPGVVRRDEAPVDHPGPRLGVGERGDDDELVGVGDDDPLDGSVSSAVRRSTVRRSSTRTIRARASGPPATSPTMRDLVADDDALAAELAGLHRRDDPLALLRPRLRPAGGGVAATVDADDHRDERVLVRGPVLGARPRARGSARTRTSLSSRSRQLPPALPPRRARAAVGEHAVPEAGEVGHGLARSCRRPRPSCPSPAGRGPPPPSPSGGRGRCGTGPPCSAAGMIRRPSSVSATAPPRACISVVRAASRSVSWPRMCATPADPRRRRRRGRRARRRRGSARRVVQVDVDARRARPCPRR